MSSEEAVLHASEWMKANFGRVGNLLYVQELCDSSECLDLLQRCGLSVERVRHLWGWWLIGFQESRDKNGAWKTIDVAVNPTTKRVCLQSMID